MSKQSYYQRNRAKCAAAARARYAADPAAACARSRAYAKTHSAARNAYQRKRWVTKGRAEYLLHKYDLTLAQYTAMLKHQEHKCSICLRKFRGCGSRCSTGPCVDHDHATGIVRGILCNRCNRILGALNLSGGEYATAQRIIAYLQLNNKPT